MADETLCCSDVKSERAIALLGRHALVARPRKTLAFINLAKRPSFGPILDIFHFNSDVPLAGIVRHPIEKLQIVRTNDC